MVKSGIIYKSKEGLDFRILKYNGLYCTIRNEELGIINRVNTKDIEHGLASLYHPNGGYVICPDDKAYSEIKEEKSYKCWLGILNRVGKGRYKDVKIHSEWLDYWSFKKFYDKWYREGYSLDKDLLSKKEKIYSPDTCCFLPPCINTAIRECSGGQKAYATKNGEYYFTVDLGKGYSYFTVTSKTKQEYENLYALYRCIKIRTLLSLHEAQIMPSARRRLKKLYNYKYYGKDID